VNADGQTNWFFNIGMDGDETVLGSPAVGTSALYFGAENGQFIALTNGPGGPSPQWIFQATNQIWGAPLICNDGSLVFTDESGFVYALFGSSTLCGEDVTSGPWPTFHQNAQRTGVQPGSATPAEDCGAPFIFGGTNDGMGDFTFSIEGVSNTTWNVYASTNLSNWVQICTNLTLEPPSDGSSTTGTNVFTDTNAGGFNERFYELANGSCCSDTIGYVTLTIQPGTNLIADQLVQVDDGVLFTFLGEFNTGGTDPNGIGCPMNTLNALFDPYPWALNVGQTSFYEWTGSGFIGDTNEGGPGGLPEWASGHGDLTMLPGTGVLVVNSNGFPSSPSTPYSITFVGTVRPQQVVLIQPGTNFLSPTVPITGAITAITRYVPQTGDIIKKLDTNSQTYVSHTYASGSWSNGTPSNGIGEGFVLISASTNSYTFTNTWLTTVCSSP